MGATRGGGSGWRPGAGLTSQALGGLSGGRRGTGSPGPPPVLGRPARRALKANSFPHTLPGLQDLPAGSQAGQPSTSCLAAWA